MTIPKIDSPQTCGNGPDEPTCGYKMPCTLEIISFPLMLEFWICCLLFSFRKSEVITDVYSHLWKQETLWRPIENATVTLSDPGGTICKRRPSKIIVFAEFAVSEITTLSCALVFRLWILTHKKNPTKTNGWFLASCRALQVTNVSECGLCQCFQLFLPNSVCSFSLFWGFVCVFLFFILTMAVLEPFSQIKKNRTCLVLEDFFIFMCLIFIFSFTVIYYTL